MTKTAIEAIGGALPLETRQFAERAYAATLNPQRNPLKEVMDACPSVEQTPPFLGIFNDIPRHRFRASEAHAWARAGFSWVVNDAEHCQWEGHYGREQNATLLHLGLLPVQRLPREAASAHGDALQMGARATMRPYGTSYEEAERYLRAIRFPTPGRATPLDRGGYPMRHGDRRMTFTPDSLREAENEIQGWIQFETAEYILDIVLRDRVLDLMARQDRHTACVFVGPFDAVMRAGDRSDMRAAIGDLLRAAARRGLHAGLVVGPGATSNPSAIEEAMAAAMENGARLIAVHLMTSDLTYHGAAAVAQPFFRACKRCGF